MKQILKSRGGLLMVLLFIPIYFFMSVFVHAKKLEGQIYYKDDTLDVMIAIPHSLFGGINYEAMQRKIKFYDQNNRKIKMKPNMIVGFSFNANGTKEFMLSRRFGYSIFGPQKGPNVFLHLLVDGQCKLFEFHQTTESGGGPNTPGSSTSVTLNLIQTKNGTLMYPRSLWFRSDMAGLFRDCLELENKIQNKEYRWRDIFEIVRFYNRTCGSE